MAFGFTYYGFLRVLASFLAQAVQEQSATPAQMQKKIENMGVNESLRSTSAHLRRELRQIALEQHYLQFVMCVDSCYHCSCDPEKFVAFVQVAGTDFPDPVVLGSKNREVTWKDLMEGNVPCRCGQGSNLRRPEGDITLVRKSSSEHMPAMPIQIGACHKAGGEVSFLIYAKINGSSKSFVTLQEFGRVYAASIISQIPKIDVFRELRGAIWHIRRGERDPTDGKLLEAETTTCGGLDFRKFESRAALHYQRAEPAERATFFDEIREFAHSVRFIKGMLSLMDATCTEPILEICTEMEFFAKELVPHVPQEIQLQQAWEALRNAQQECALREQAIAKEKKEHRIKRAKFEVLAACLGDVVKASTTAKTLIKKI
jgi:hypothetical protein